MKLIGFLYLGMLLISLVLIFFATKYYSKTQNLLRNGMFAEATVIDLIKKNSKRRSTFTPVFEYTDHRKKVCTFKSDVSSRPAAYHVGETVSIVYSEDNKEQKIISFWGLYLWPVVLLSIASPLLIIGGGYILYSTQ